MSVRVGPLRQEQLDFREVSGMAERLMHRVHVHRKQKTFEQDTTKCDTKDFLNLELFHARGSQLASNPSCVYGQA